MIVLLQIILKSLNNYATEEFFQTLDPALYATYIENRKHLIDTYFSMVHIHGYHRNFLWTQFEEAYKMPPKEYFVKHFDKLVNFQESYDTTIQQGYITFSAQFRSNPNPSTMQGRNE